MSNIEFSIGNEGYDKLLQYGLRILSKKRYTVEEVRKKFIIYSEKIEGDGQLFVKPVIDRLKELRYLNDQAFARDYIAERTKLRPRGKFLIKRELEKKGLPEKIIEEAFGKIEVDEYQIALDLLLKKMARWSKEPLFKQKSKAYSFLCSKGINREDVYKAIGNCYNSGE